MPKLVINPGTPQAREFELKPGTNYVGRGFANDLKLEDPSVSSSHAQIIVNGGTVTVQDLGSTNGTFINRSPIKEGVLQPSTLLRFGGVELMYQADAAGAPAIPIPVPVPVAIPTSDGGLRIPAATTPPPVSVATPVASSPTPPRAPGLQISRPPPPSAATEAPPLEPPIAHPMAPPLAPPIPSAPAAMPTGVAQFCRFHPKSRARFLCPKCKKGFCEFCITTRENGTKRLCRTCGVDLTPLQVQIEQETHRGFFPSIPGAFVYPLRGMGPVILVLATLLYEGPKFASRLMMGANPGTSIFGSIFSFGFLYLFMQSILHTTTTEEKEPMGFPDLSEIYGAAFSFLGTMLMAFALPIALFAARFGGIEIPAGAMIAADLIACVYFPMCFLVIAMKDSVMAGNPLVVIPSIMKIPLQYLITCALMMVIYVFYSSGDFIMSFLGATSFASSDMSVMLTGLVIRVLWALISIYLMSVNIRILGLFYNANKDELGWF